MKLALSTCALLLILIFPFLLCAEDYGATARGAFALLPSTIFENTPAGLSDNDKQELLYSGSTTDWEIAAETPDIMVLAELPFRDRSVALRLFRNEQNGNTEVAIGTVGTPVCTVELWQIDNSGRIIPIELPEEPKFEEFYIKKPKKFNHNSVLICLGLGGLAAKPIVYDHGNLYEPEVDKEISYQWDGAKFLKLIQPKKSNPDLPE